MHIVSTIAGGKALKNVLLSFSYHDCEDELQSLGFPKEYGALDETFETAQVGRREDGELHTKAFV